MIMSMVMNNSTVNIVINNPCCNNPFLQLAVYKMINDSWFFFFYFILNILKFKLSLSLNQTFHI